MTFEVTALELMKFCPAITFCTRALSSGIEVVPSHGASGASAWPVGDVVLVGPRVEVPLLDAALAAVVPSLAAK